MWIMTRDGFFSTVKKPNQENEVTVRARVKNDLERLMRRLDIDTDIIENGGTDYPFRIVMKQKLWSKYLQKTGQDIDYDNFKASLDHKDHARHAAYFKCWSALMGLEN